MEIYVPGTTTDDWQRFLETTTKRWPSAYTEDGESARLPKDVREIFRRSELRACLLQLELTPLVSLNVHFFTQEELELDLDPREVRAQADLDAVIAFMRTLGLAVGRPVYMGIESSEPRPPEDLRYEPARNRVVFRS